ncbi:MAG: glutamine-hydrolyzing GMP synthase [Candidatus Omnitrophica bacterium]|nr:glutamine-hydrolyzing GMP synthase [Candidatus Omnitrophota bacterium]
MKKKKLRTKSTKNKAKARKLRPKSRRIKLESRKPGSRGARSSKKAPAAKVSRQTILILDFGSQYTQLIARRVRENKVFSSIIPYNTPAKDIQAMQPKGLILSGGPASVTKIKKSPYPDKGIFKLGVPVLGVCYGMQVIAEMLGGKVKSSREREFGKIELFIDDNRDLFAQMPGNFSCWASHGDELKKFPSGFHVSAHTLNAPIAAISNRQRKIYGVQFHPEVTHTEKGNQIISNFLFKICGCLSRWTMQSFIRDCVENLKKTIGRNDKVIMGLSGGVDSAVAAVLVHRAIGRNLRSIFIDNGVLRKDEEQQIKQVFRDMYHLNLGYVNRSKRFLAELKGITDPEEKRKVIGREFVRVFEEESKKIRGAKYLGQGTLYPDVIESTSPGGAPSSKIKSHHNVGGLPAHMKLKLIEPLRELFKDEVRKIAAVLNMPENIITRQPFPGPGLAIRIIGEVTQERLSLLREADRRVIEEIRKAGLYEQIWQSFAILLPVKTVGVMGDERTYENVIALRCVTSFDGMTADWAKVPYEVLEKISNRIINEVKGINRVVYDISSKPPATIEWE